jgi:hypothetical protein
MNFALRRVVRIELASFHCPDAQNFVVAPVFLKKFVKPHIYIHVHMVTRGGAVVEALHYKPKGRGFDS